MFSQVRDKNSNFFTRISNLDRLKWVVFEAWVRQEYNMKMIDDTAFETLKNLKCIPDSLLKRNPSNYNILSNYNYWDKLGFKAAGLLQGKHGNPRSNQIVEELFGCKSVESDDTTQKTDHFELLNSNNDLEGSKGMSIN